MFRNFDINAQGFSVRCRIYYDRELHGTTDVVIATHGFGGYKENRSIEKFAERLTTKYRGFAVLCFDWPCHGADARKKLLLSECMTYLELAVRYAQETIGAQRVYNYSASFGAYLTLKYIAERGDPFYRTALRCPAIRMYDSMLRSSVTEEDLGKLAKGKEILIGRERKLKIDQGFLDALKAGDITRISFLDYADSILILHGTKDEMVPFAESAAFADDNVIELIPVERADHKFTDPKSMDFVIQKIIEFFAPEA